MRKRWYFPKKMENIFPVADGRVKPLGGDQDLRTSTLMTASTNSRRKSRWFSWRIRRVSTTTSRLTSGCRRSTKSFLVHVRKLHIPSSQRTSSSTPCAKRRIIPYSTEIHWRNQNYSYEFGCQTRATYRWLFKYRWVKRFVWFLDRFHSIYSIGRKTSRRIYVVQGEIDEKTADIQARLFVARTLGENGKERQAEGEAKNGPMNNRNSIMPEDYEEFISLTLRTRSSKKPLGMLARNWKHQWLPLCLAKQARRVSMERPVAKPMRSNQNLRVFWKQMNPQDCAWKISTELSWGPFCRKRGQFTATLQFGAQIYSFSSSNEDTCSKSSSG